MSFFVRADRQRFAVAEVPALPQAGFRGVAIVLSAVLAILTDQTASAISNAGLPYLATLTTASPDEASWIVTAFNAAYYAMILFSPWMMARCGRKRLMLVALLGFAVTSVLLAIVSDYHLFVLLRFVQGAFLGCIYVPAALLLFTTIPTHLLKFAPPAFVLVSLSGATLGTAIGAFFADEYGGNTVFVPGCIATLVTAALIFFTVRAKDAPQRDLPIDLMGLTLSILSFGALQFLVNEGQRRNWFDDPSIVFGAAVLLVALPAFVCYELFLTRDPHVDFRMFANHRNLAVGGVINATIGVVGYSVTLFVGYLQSAIGATSTLAGELVTVRIATYALGVPIAFLLISRRILDLRFVVASGVVGSAVALYAFSHSMTTTADAATFVSLSLFFGFFFGMLNQPMGTLVVGSMPLTLLAAGVSIYKLSSPFGAMIGTGVLQTLLEHQLVWYQSDIAGRLTLARSAVQQYVFEHHGTVGLSGIARLQAQTLAYAHVMELLAGIVLLVVPVVFFARLQPARVPPETRRE